MCSTTALEPDEQCPIHGNPYPTRCVICGQFMKNTTIIKTNYKALLRPMFTSTIMFGYATEEQVDKYLNETFS